MSASLEAIKKPIEKELNAFEVMFKQSMKTRVPLLDIVLNYILKRKGKQIRPLFVMYTAKLFGDINIRTYRGASLVELLHTATLVHDDVVDDANERRGFFSVNALWKNKIAVLVGDFLLSQGLLLTTSKNRIDLLHIVSKAVKAMSEGELLQMEKSRKMDITENIYYKIIEQKTASLVAACCGTGACSVTDDKKIISTMENVGIYVGMAFQIKDDIFDYGTGEHIGKPTGIDIREQKMTLPLIYVMNHSPSEIRKELMYIMKNEYDVSSKIKRVIQLVIQYGGIQFAANKMESIANEALELLKSFPVNDAKNALIGLVHYTMNREK